ncbi:MAG: hypothetical protein HZC24_10130 [Rhodocyclales bacterium]|nr:hypothetical protein [Rhodocyclales bacterium]
MVGLILLHLLPFTWRVRSFEQAASRQLEQPVNIRAVHLSLVPQPHWRLDGVSIGAGGQIEIPRVRMIAEFATLLSDHPAFTMIELDAPRVRAEGLAWLLLGKAGAHSVAFGRVEAGNVAVDVGNLSLPTFDVSADVGADGRWQKIVARSQDRRIGVELQPNAESIQVVASASSLALPFAAAPKITDLRATGTVGRHALELTTIEGRVLGGGIDGNARLAWGATLSLEGEVLAKRIDAAQLYPELFDEGRLDLTAAFALPLDDAERPAPRLAGRFSIARGTLRGVDLGSVLKNLGVGGRTRFAKLEGSVLHEVGRTQLREMRLDAGPMSATGTADVDADGAVRGHAAVLLAFSGQRHNARLELAGNFQPPYGRNIRWIRR